MAVLCGWASIGETGNGRNNRPGDQTGREVKLGDWYYFGQKVVYRWKNRKLAERYASIIKAFCKNNHIGYDMNDRTTLFNLLEKHKWNYKKVDKNVETDCSQLVACAINCTIGKEVCNSGMWTGNINKQLMNSGYFTRYTAKKYLEDDDYLMVGDIINAPDHHVISCLGNGSKVKKTTTTKKKTETKTDSTKKSYTEVAKEVISGKWGNGIARKDKLKKAGYDPEKVQQKVNDLLNSKSTTQIAKEVIKGKWGNGAERKRRLIQAGYDYNAVQKKVNELSR